MLFLSHVLSLADYIIVITGRENCGPLMGHDVYHALDFDILPLGPGISVKDPGHPVESHLLALVRTHLNSGYFLFSYGTDLTRRMQAQYEAQEKDQGKALWEVVRINIRRYMRGRYAD
jgi:phosphatidylinositol 4-phosphatase